MTESNNDQRRNAIVLAKDSGSLKQMLEVAKGRIAEVLPRHLSPERLMRVALGAVTRTPLLQACTAQSIVLCVMQGAQLGLDVSGVLGQGYCVPFFNKNIGAYEATFIPGYRGLLDLARRSGEIEDIFAEVVYEGDEFEYSLGDNPHITHKPDISANADRSDDKLVLAYMVAFLKGSARPHIEVMTRADIQKVKKSSKAAFDKEGNEKVGPWRDWFPAMARKTVIRRGIKYLPMSVELAEAMQVEDESQEKINKFIDVPHVEINQPAEPQPEERAAGLAKRLKKDNGNGNGKEAGNHEEQAIPAAGEGKEESPATPVQGSSLSDPGDNVFLSAESFYSYCSLASADMGMAPNEFSFAWSQCFKDEAAQKKASPKDRKAIWSALKNRQGHFVAV